jgi:iron complex transport system substrate-binding protein
LLQKEKEAEALFRSIEKQYTENKSLTPLEKRPAVFIGSREGSSWFAAPANSYLAQLINDAGGKYLLNHRSAPGNLLLKEEELTAMCWNIPFFGLIAYSGEPISRAWMADQAPSLRQSPTFQKEQLFYCNALEADFFGKALIEPHVLLRELRSLFEPSASASVPAVYFQKAP